MKFEIYITSFRRCINVYVIFLRTFLPSSNSVILCIRKIYIVCMQASAREYAAACLGIEKQEFFQEIIYATYILYQFIYVTSGHAPFRVFACVCVCAALSERKCENLFVRIFSPINIRFFSFKKFYWFIVLILVKKDIG